MSAWFSRSKFFLSSSAAVFLLLVCGLSFAQDPVEDKVLRIGIIAPSSEDEHGKSHLLGAKAVFEERKQEVMNTAHVRLELLERDSTANSSTGERQNALNHAHELIRNHGVIAILGAVNSSATIAVQEYIESLETHNAILITSSSTNTAITAGNNDWTFRNNLSDHKLTSSLAKFIFKDKQISNVAVFYADNVWGQGAYNDFSQAFEGNIVFTAPIRSDKKDFAREIALVADKKAEGICIFAWDESKASIILARNENRSTEPIPAFTIGLPHRLGRLGEEYLQGVTAVSSFFDDPHSESVNLAKKVLNKYRRLAELNFNSARAMESMHILLDAISKVKSTDPVAIRDEVRKTRYLGLNYEIQFDSKTGDLLHAEPILLDYYGKWVNLNDWRTYVQPITNLIMVLFLFALIYLLSRLWRRLSRPISLFAASLPVAILLIIAYQFWWTSIGPILSNITITLGLGADILAVGSVAYHWFTSHKRVVEI